MLLFGPAQNIDLFTIDFRIDEKERSDVESEVMTERETDLGMLYIFYSRHSPMDKIKSLFKVNCYRTCEMGKKLMPINVEC